MTLEPQDITALRLVESRFYHFDDPALTAAGLTWDWYRNRINRLCAGGVIRSFHLTLLVPPILGGNWVWAAILGSAENPYETSRQLITRLPFVTEILFNSCLPANIGPNLGLLFFSRDFESETRFINSITELRQLQVIKIAEYPYPVSQPISREEKAFIRLLYHNPGADAQTIASAFGQNLAWVRAKIERLLWTKENRSGIIRIQPSIDWSKAQNFGHFHFLLETGHRPEQIARLIGDHGFELVLSGRPISGRYLGVEADVWGIPDLYQRIEFLEKLNGVKVAGVIYNQELLINDRWVEKIIGD